MKTILAVLLLCGSAFAQQEVKISQAPENAAFTQIFHFTGTNLDYICTAQALQQPSQITITTASNANPVSFTATAHGIYYSASGVVAKPVIFISGASGGWASINGTFIATPTGANSFTIPIDSTAFGAWGAQSVVVTTKAALTTKAVWAVQSLVPDASGNTVFMAYRSDSTTTTLGTLGSGSTARTTCTAPSSFQ